VTFGRNREGYGGRKDVARKGRKRNGEEWRERGGGGLERGIPLKKLKRFS
jgi:hypothetical protein